MDGIWFKIRRNLALPLPELYATLCARVVARLWAPQLGATGRKFYVSLGTRIMGGKAVHIGDRFHMGKSLWIEAVGSYRGVDHAPVIRIGDDVTGSDYIHIAATTAVTIGNGVLLGSRVHITDHAHGRYAGAQQDAPIGPPAMRRLSTGTPVVIGNNVWLGDAVVVLPGVSIGDGTIVGANSVVSRSLPAGVIAVGIPARPIKRYDADARQWLPTSAST